MAKDVFERRAIHILEEIVAMDRRDRDALPGSAVLLCKRALRILRKRQNRSSRH